MNWSELPEFTGIDLQDTWVLSWAHEGNQLTFQLEASIWPNSEYYELPKVNGYTCYKPAKLTFKEFRIINGILSMSDVKPAIGADGEKDYGSIDNLEVGKDRYCIYGEFGCVEIVGGVMLFAIET